MLRSFAGHTAARVALAALISLPTATRAESVDDDSVKSRQGTIVKAGYVSNHVVVISVDGLRPDAISRFNARTIQRLMRGGSYSLAARTIYPSKTLPSHTSMLTGLDTDAHGVTWNSDRTKTHGHIDVPTIFGLARSAGFRTAAFFSKPKFHHLEAANTLDHVRSPSGSITDGRWSSARTVSEVEKYLASPGGQPNLMFVHIAEPDYAGHVFGWMSYMYGRGVRNADEAVERLLEAADRRFGAGNYSVILTADHGGHGRNHGTEDARDTTIPWIVWGKGVAAGVELDGIRTMDTAATALWLLGVAMPSSFEGRAILRAFASSSAIGSR